MLGEQLGRDIPKHMEIINIGEKFKKLFHAECTQGLKRSEMLTILNINYLIKENEYATVSIIADKMHMTNAAASKTIGELEDMGLVEKIINKKDKRQSYLVLTQKGQDKVENMKSNMDIMLDNVYRRMGDTDMKMMIELLNKFYTIFESEHKLLLEKGKKQC